MTRAALALRAALAAALVLPARPAGAQDVGMLPVSASVAVDDSETAVTGQFTLRLAFTPSADIARPYSVQVVLATYGRAVLTKSHSPEPPTIEWRKGVKVEYDLPAPFPFDADLRGVESLDVLLAFVDPATGRLLRPSTAPDLSGGMAVLARMAVPKPTSDVDAVLASADALAREGRKAAAWDALEFGLRRALDDPTKHRYRDAMVKLGPFPPPPLTLDEQQIVAGRIDEERVRHLREVAGRFFDQGKLHAALRIVERIGGKLAEQAGKAVLGALADAQRAEKDAQDIRERLVERVTPEERAEAEAAIRRTGLGRDLLARVEEWARKGRWAVARHALTRLYRDAGDAALEQEAYGRLKELDKSWCAATPPEEQALVDAAVDHPAFARTAWSPSQRFVFIGPKTLVEGIPAQSRLRFDLAYVFLTDLFGRRPNPAGDRVTVYFKELFDFGGGTGGGKRIDIGRANPDARETRVDNGLLYHELTHCVDDTEPTYAGFREGLANVGAAYCFDSLGQSEDVLHSFASNLDAFRRDYLARDLEYWRIPNYGPSAGFFLHFVDKYGRAKQGRDWSGYRRFFRDYRDAPVKDGREPFVARMLAHHLVEAFGPDAFDDLVSFRFPLVASDRDAVRREADAYAQGESWVLDEGERLGDCPNSPLPRDLRERRFVELFRDPARESDARAYGRDELGVVYDWRCIGPFEQAGADPGTFPFPPEYEVDFARQYPGRGNICKWTAAQDTGAVTVDASGWVGFNFSYADDTASYAMTHATVPADTEAWAYLRADDDATLFVGGDLVDAYPARGIASSLLWWRGPEARVPDAMRFAVTLRKGRNRVLVKVRNRRGASGFVLALCGRDGRPIEGLATDLDPPSPPVWRNPPPPEDHWREALLHRFTAKGAASKLQVTAGRFDVANKLLAGGPATGAVAWRKYTVRPGFPKDSPSNLAWLPAKATDDVDAFRLTLDVAPPRDEAPKIGVTFQGEGEADGLSGWTLLVRGAGKGRVQASLERYDRQVYESAPLDFAWAETLPVVLTYEGRRVTVTVANAALLADVPVNPIPGRRRIGFTTWGPDPKVAGLRLEVPVRGK